MSARDERDDDMAAISDVRGDITPDEVTAALHAGLGRRYHVLAAHRIDEPVLDPRPGTPGTIVVATGSDRFFRAQVTISRDSGQTTLHIKPGGLPGVWPGLLRLINRLTVARTVRNVLRGATSLR
jgi:hypothetical protein